MPSRRAAALILLLACLMPAYAAAAGLEGSWQGRLSIGFQKLRIALHIEPDGSCTFDSPDQGATGIPARVLVMTPDSLAVEMPSIGASFAGRLQPATGRLRGKLSQGPYRLPLTLAPGTADGPRRPQNPVAPFPYTTSSHSIATPDGAVLSATLTLPDSATAATPLAVLVSGSGLQNRDEEIAGHRPFAVIADRLARHGIATLRYDDRGWGRSTGSNETATTATYADDAAAAADYVRSLGHTGPVGIIGHSEGGTIAFMLAARGKADFAVSIAGAALPGLDILLAQNRLLMQRAATDSLCTEAYCRALQAVLTGRTPATDDLLPLTDAMRDNLLKAARTMTPWMRRFVAYNPAADIAAARCPVMAIGGTLDTQVDADTNLAIVRRFLPDDHRNLVRAYPELNHLMQPCTTGFTDEYARIELTIDPQVLADITDWILSVAGCR